MHVGWWGSTSGDLQSAINSLKDVGGDVLLTDMSIPVELTTQIEGFSNVNLRGVGFESYIYSVGGGNRQEPIMKFTDVNNVTIEKIHIAGGSGAQPHIFLAGNCDNITIQHGYFNNGYSGVWMDPGANKTIQNVTIFANTMREMSHPISLGGTDGEITTDLIKLVKVIGNYCHAVGDAGSDGIKLRKKSSDILIQGNVFEGTPGVHGDNIANSGDGADLFVSGERVSVIGNLFFNFGVHGLELKTDETNYPPTTWGKGRQVIVRDNILHSNSNNGIRILTQAGQNEWPYMIDVLSNCIYKNDSYGIECSGRHINIAHNQIFLNCLDINETSTTGLCGVLLKANQELDPPLPSEYITLTNNLIANNGNQNMGLKITDYVHHVEVLNNIVTNDSAIGATNQNFGISVSSNTTNIQLKDNHASGHNNLINDRDLVINTGAGVIGETLTCQIGSIAQGDEEEHPVFFAPSKMCLVSVRFINAEDVDSNGSDYEALSIYNKHTNQAIFSFFTDTKDIDAFKTTDMEIVTSNNSSRYFDENDVLSFKKTNVGDGKALNQAVVLLNYVTY